jgi:hypothetical protein
MSAGITGLDMRSLNTALDKYKDSFLVAASKVPQQLEPPFFVRVPDSYCSLCQAGSEEEVASLLDMGANVNWIAPDGDGDTALLAACRNGHRTVVNMLLALGADTSASSSA